MAVGSPFLNSLDLESTASKWRWPEVDLAHPLDDGSAGVMVRSIAETVDGLGEDGAAWRRLFGASSAHFDALNDDMLRPIVHLPRHPIRLARFGIPAAPGDAARPQRGARRRPGPCSAGSPHTRSAAQPADELLGRLRLIAACHRYGWAVAKGGSRSITDALAAVLTEHGGTIETGRRVRSLAELPDADIVAFDLAPRAVAEIAGERLPGRVARAYRRYRHGPGAFKVDLAVEGGVPWTNEACRPAGTVHVIGSFEELVAAGAGHQPRPDAGAPLSCSSASSTSPTRSARQGTCTQFGPTPTSPTATAATRPRRCSARSSALPRASASGSWRPGARTPADLAADNANYVGGDIITGANTPVQVLIRPRFALDPYSTGIPGSTSARRRLRPAPARTG